MSAPLFQPPVAPAPGVTVKPKLKLLKAEFGDGYTQTMRDGLNHMRRTVKLEWPILRVEHAREIVGFFEERGGDLPFLFQLPDDAAPLRYTCEEWDSRYLQAGLRAVSATFEQDFNLGGAA
ncbi:MAG: phage tail protein [Salinarimonas sp.]